MCRSCEQGYDNSLIIIRAWFIFISILLDRDVGIGVPGSPIIYLNDFFFFFESCVLCGDIAVSRQARIVSL